MSWKKDYLDNLTYNFAYGRINNLKIEPIYADRTFLPKLLHEVSIHFQ